MSIFDKIFIPITKVDEEQRLVFGTLAVEEVDRTNEILDYEASKPAFEAWTEHYKSVTGGKSAGNLRVMHGDKVAGKFVDVGFDDATKSIPVCAKVLDDDTWTLVKEGAMTGFSIGARAAWRKKEQIDGKDVTRYAVKTLVEASLVDAPCIPSATFECIKSDGQVEIRKFQAPKVANSKYDNSVARDFKTGFIAAKVALEKVGSADRTLGAFHDVAQSAGLRKSLWDASDLACCLMTINRIRLNLAAEAQWEGDSSPLPEKLRSWLDEGSQLLQDLVSEESAELTADAPADVMTMAEQPEIKKTETTMPDVKPVEKAEVVTEAAKTEEVVKTETPDLQKSMDSVTEKISKYDEAVSKLSGQVNDLTTAVQTITEILQTLKNTPAPVKGVAAQAVAISKAQDNSDVTKVEEPKDTKSAFKMALAPENAKAVFPR